MNELPEIFKKNAELTTAKVIIVSSKDLVKCISDEMINEESALISLMDHHLINQLPSNVNYITTPTNDELKNVKLCLTDSVCGIAETGSIIISNDNHASFFTMLSRKHLVILKSNDLYRKPREIFEDPELSKLSSYSVITGPSATADMGSLVRGVHGPEHLIIILVNDDE